VSRVAVIVVHGVADQEPGRPSAEIADLLANLNDAGAPAYASFVGESVRIPVRPLPIPDDFRRGAATFADRAAGLRAMKRQTTEPVDTNIEFMSALIAAYELGGPAETFETTVLRSTRHGRADTFQPVETDVFEMFWADLSRLSQNWLSIFTELYQLLFHLGSLGVHVVTAAQIAEADQTANWPWAWWTRAQRASANALAVGMLVPNLMLAMLTAILALRWTPGISRVADTVPMALVALAVGGSLLWLLMRSYSRYRPGALRVFSAMGGAVSGVYVGSLFLHRGDEPLLQAATVNAAELAYLLLSGAFVWLIVNAWIAVVMACYVATRPGASRPKMRRVAWTAALTLSLQAIVFSIVTTFAWAAIALLLSQVFDGFASAQHTPLLLGGLVRGTDGSLGAFVEVLIHDSAGIGFGLTVGLTVLATLIVLFYVVPAAWLEVFTPPEGADGTRGGRRLSKGFRVMRSGGWLLFFGIVIALPVGTVASVGEQFGLTPHLDVLRFWTNEVLLWAGGALLAGATTMIAFRARLKSLALQMRNGIDIALDVDNYLREHPRSSTPRARIAARYVSVLRHILRQGYDRIVIVAHSQGTVITADLLRYVTWNETHAPGYRDKAGLANLATTPITLFTMGCPLRQLYGLRFPHLYGWARFEDAVGGANGGVIPPGCCPSPAAIGVDRWVNAYRSSDYVGRQLWRLDDSADLFRSSPARNGQPWAVGPFPVVACENATSPPSSREFCIGRGAHTHYWDGTAPQIALELDTLIGP
jgi:hypothetical protein